MRQFYLFLSFLFLSFLSSATSYTVGTGLDYSTPNSLYQADILNTGDTILINAETYSGMDCLGVWTPDSLVFIGVGGMPRMIANGEYIWGKGIWVIRGANCTVQNIEFSGATVPDQNGAGIRLDGTGIHIISCYFHDNENGILTGNSGEGTVIIEQSEFDHNGYGDGYSHNLYIGHIETLVFYANYSHHANEGHNLKSRAANNLIYYNRIMDEETGNSSRLIDVSNGGFTIIMGNLLMQGNNAPNNNLVAYGPEGLSNPVKYFYFINNTLVNKRQGSCIFLDIKDGTAIANVSNNIFAGKGTVMRGSATEMHTNLVNENIDAVGFANEQEYDYNLEENSIAVDYGTALDSIPYFSLTPEYEYVHLAQARIRPNDSNIDAGAYEWATVVDNQEKEISGVVVSPNPSQGIINISMKASDIKMISVYDLEGRRIRQLSAVNIINIQNEKSGVYWIEINTKSGKVIHRTIMKY